MSPGERLGELAGHWAAAVVSVDAAKAIHYARRAGERALEQLAPDEAVRWYRQALELHDQAPGGDRSERCELLIGLGEAQRQVGNPDFRETLLDAATLARELGDTDRLCARRDGQQPRTAPASSAGWTPSVCRRSKRPQRPSRTRSAAARVLALLASELHFGGDPARCRALAAEAIEIARAGGDPAALAHTLEQRDLRDPGARHACGAPA